MNDLESLIVDANAIISALLRGAALSVFQNPKIKRFLTTDFTLGEVKHYVPRLARKLRLPEEILHLDLELLPLKLYPREAYSEKLKEARSILLARDPNDIDLLALAFHLKLPIWSNDKDFQGTGTKIYTTAQLLKLLESVR